MNPGDVILDVDAERHRVRVVAASDPRLVTASCSCGHVFFGGAAIENAPWLERYVRSHAQSGQVAATRTQARCAGNVDATWIGRAVAVGIILQDSTQQVVAGVLSDVAHVPTHHRTFLWIAGQRVDVNDAATVIVDELGLYGATP